MRLGRRALLSTLGTFALPRVALAQSKDAPPPPPADLELRDIRVDGDRALGRRFLLCVPRYVPRGMKLPLLVLLHGLGETIDETLGVRAWVDRYGLGTSFDRLRRPPAERTWKQRKDFSDERIAAVNADLMRGPFEGFAIACPYTPKATKPGELDAYARWILEVVVPRARREVAIFDEPELVAIDGCSLGGFVGLEVFLRAPEAFGAWGDVQAVMSAATAPSYAERVAKALAPLARRPSLHVETSTEDVFRPGNERLATDLEQRGVARDLLVLPGWHDQPWLREAGTLEMLLWHDRRFRAARDAIGARSRAGASGAGR